MQHIRDGLEVLHLKNLGVNVTTETKLRSFLWELGPNRPCLATTKLTEKREQAPALHMELSIGISIAQDRVKSRKTLRKLWRFDPAWQNPFKSVVGLFRFTS